MSDFYPNSIKQFRTHTPTPDPRSPFKYFKVLLQLLDLSNLFSFKKLFSPFFLSLPDSYKIFSPFECGLICLRTLCRFYLKFLQIGYWILTRFSLAPVFSFHFKFLEGQFCLSLTSICEAIFTIFLSNNQFLRYLSDIPNFTISILFGAKLNSTEKTFYKHFRNSYCDSYVFTAADQ